MLYFESNFVKCKCGDATKVIKAGVSKIFEENFWTKRGARTNFFKQSKSIIDFCHVIYSLFFGFNLLFDWQTVL